MFRGPVNCPKFRELNETIRNRGAIVLSTRKDIDFAGRRKLKLANARHHERGGNTSHEETGIKNKVHA